MKEIQRDCTIEVWKQLCEFMKGQGLLIEREESNETI